MDRRLLVAAVVGACYHPDAGPGAPCTDNDTCPRGLVCSFATQTCERGDAAPAVDAAADGLVVDTTTALASCPAADARLAACYAFEGTTQDSSTNANHATVAGNLGFAAGINGSAVVLSASSNILVPDTPSLDLSTAMTVDAWVRLDAPPAAGERSVIADHNSGYAFYVLDTRQFGCGLFLMSGASRRVEGPVAIAIGTWTHVACTFDGSTLRSWVNGAMMMSQAVPSPIATASPDGMRIGGNYPDGVNPNPELWIGTIDQFRIWNAVLSATELCTAAGTC